MRILILLALVAYAKAIAPGDPGSWHCDICSCNQSVIRTFDGKYGLIRSEQKTTLFRGKDATYANGDFGGALDPCKTQIRCVTSNDCWWNQGLSPIWLDWCGVALNVHQRPDKGSHRNWIISQILDYIGERGQGFGGDTLIYFDNSLGNNPHDPEIWYPSLPPPGMRTPDCDPHAIARRVGDSIEIETPCCGWAVRWTPKVACTCIEIFMDNSWATTTEGMCGNSNGNPQDDPDNCGAVCSGLPYPDLFDCWSDDCATTGPNTHSGQGFVGCTRLHEDTMGSPMPGACLQ